jgi:hypothetical protein
MKALFTILCCSVFLNTAAAQDDCPPGHVRHPAISALDDASMIAAAKASFRGIYGRDATLVPGSGVDDLWYYVRQANHFGVYGDDQCHAGWSGYWESWLRVGHGDLALVQSPAQFRPEAPPPVMTPPVIPPPVFSDAAILAQLATLKSAVDELARASGDAHAAINQNITDGRTENRNFFKAVGDHWRSIAAVAGPFVTWYATRRAFTQ